MARWTRKFNLSGSRHPTRNRPMKADKLFYAYEWIKGLVLSLQVTTGATRLSHVGVEIARRLIEDYQPQSLTLILDAGGCSLKALKGLFRLVREHAVTFYVKAVKTPNLKALWQIALDRWGTQQIIHPDDEGLPAAQQRHLHVAEVYTQLAGCGEDIRTILIHNPKEDQEQKRLIAIYTSDEKSTPAEVYATFCKRQRHELTYRVMIHDLNLDALPKTYATRAKDPKHPKRKTKIAFLIGCIKAVAFNLMRAWQQTALPESFHTTTLGTLIRRFIRQNATVEMSEEKLVVTFDYFRDQRRLYPSDQPTGA